MPPFVLSSNDTEKLPSPLSASLQSNFFPVLGETQPVSLTALPARSASAWRSVNAFLAVPAGVRYEAGDVADIELLGTKAR